MDYLNMWVAVVLVSVAVLISFAFEQIQPTPYLDEVFHIPQAIRYCRGNFYEWDSKITTLPGLYLLSVGVLKPLSIILGLDLCTTYGLRAINAVTAVINGFLIFKIQQKITPKPVQIQCNGFIGRDAGTAFKSVPQVKVDDWEDEKQITSHFNVATFPVLFFFSFLYYTDPMATGFVLLTYLLELENCSLVAALIGALAVLVRQTNIVWVAFIGYLALWKAVQNYVEQYNGRTISGSLNSFQYFQVLNEVLVRRWRSGFQNKKELVMKILTKVWGYILVGVCFAGFVFWNKGLVVGDRSAHEAVVHIPQLFYFALFVLFFAFPYLLSYFQDFLLCIYKNKIISMLIIMICVMIIYCNTLVHPYLLADNRHFSFYIWKRLYERHALIRYALIPAYMFGAYGAYRMLQDMSIVFKIGYFVFVGLCLVPQKLLEFRYFILPFLFLRLHHRTDSIVLLSVECIHFGFINCLTFNLFLTREFMWSDMEGPQRFLW